MVQEDKEKNIKFEDKFNISPGIRIFFSFLVTSTNSVTVLLV